MSNRSNTQEQGRRTPLSLSVGGKQGSNHHQSQHHQQNKSTNGNSSHSNTRHVNKPVQRSDQNTEKVNKQQSTQKNVVNNNPIGKTSNEEKKPQNGNNIEKNNKSEEKKPQNGNNMEKNNKSEQSKLGNASGSSKEKKETNNQDKNETQPKNEKQDKKEILNNENLTVKNDVKSEKPKEENTKNVGNGLKEVPEKNAKEQDNIDVVSKSTEEKNLKKIDEEVILIEDDQSIKKTTDPGQDSNNGPDTKKLASSPKKSEITKTPNKTEKVTTPAKPVGRPKKNISSPKKTDKDLNKIDEPIVIDDSPAKQTQDVNTIPSAASTPSKPLLDTNKKDVQKRETRLTMDSSVSIDRGVCPRSFTQISGRRSIRPGADNFESHFGFRESYRRIKTELDDSVETNTSLSVTVGSEIPNNSSFSFFGRGRKRGRTPPDSKSAVELQDDDMLSPTKRSRQEKTFSLNSLIATPIKLLRSRFSKTSLQSSTPMNLRAKTSAEEEAAQVQNVSGVSIEEVVLSDAPAQMDVDNTVADDEKTSCEKDSIKQCATDKDTTEAETDAETLLKKCNMEKGEAAKIDDVVNNPEEPATIVAGDTKAKTSRCIVM